ncbi:MAG TPA: XisI protein [Saprospiraceae bacterium]|nr:XisI protein [Saprospiraceae bacterium]HMQ85657.1 XisI protein [Saprospiraceae bacterium]
MDQLLIKHKNIVREIIQEIAAMTPSDDTTETQLIMDDERGHYILFSVGWQGDLREYLPFVHIDVKPDAKVWLQHDGTDLRIAMWMVELGIPKSQIVLAFQHPHRRLLIEDFAIN